MRIRVFIVVATTSFLLTACQPWVALVAVAGAGAGGYASFHAIGYSGTSAKATFHPPTLRPSALNRADASDQEKTQLSSSTIQYTLYNVLWNQDDEIAVSEDGQRFYPLPLEELLSVTITGPPDNQGLPAVIVDYANTSTAVLIRYNRGDALTAVNEKEEAVYIPLENLVSLTGIRYAPFYEHIGRSFRKDKN